jgi:hypothetical protein
MNLSTADLRNYRTEFHETWWSYAVGFSKKAFFRDTVKSNKVYNEILTFIIYT